MKVESHRYQHCVRGVFASAWRLVCVHVRMCVCMCVHACMCVCMPCVRGLCERGCGVSVVWASFGDMRCVRGGCERGAV